MTFLTWVIGYVLVGAVANQVIQMIVGDHDDDGMMATLVVVLWPALIFIGGPIAGIVQLTRAMDRARWKIRGKIRTMQLEGMRARAQAAAKVVPVVSADPYLAAAEAEVEQILKGGL